MEGSWEDELYQVDLKETPSHCLQPTHKFQHGIPPANTCTVCMCAKVGCLSSNGTNWWHQACKSEEKSGSFDTGLTRPAATALNFTLQETVEESAQACKCNAPKYRTLLWCKWGMFMSYMEDRQLQHVENVNSIEDTSCYDCSSEERTLFQYISHDPKIVGQSLVQSQLGRQQ